MVIKVDGAGATMDFAKSVKGTCYDQRLLSKMTKLTGKLNKYLEEDQAEMVSNQPWTFLGPPGLAA